MLPFIADNRETTQSWEEFSPHREQVMSHLLRGPAGGTLAVLGAGNCNDLELGQLLQFYRRVHLYDLDSDALTYAVMRQGVVGHPGLNVHAPRDLSGCLNVAVEWGTQAERSPAEVGALLEQAAYGPHLGRLPVCDVVVSTTLLSQLLRVALWAPGETHAAYTQMVQTLRAAHLKLMLEMLQPGGVGILITDLVSSDTAPELLTATADELPALAVKLVNARNFFTGTNPAVIQKSLEDPAQLGQAVERVQLIRPWKWQLGPRMYLVYACKFERSTG